MRNVVLLVGFLVSAANGLTQTASPPSSTLGVSGGRFVFGQISEYRRDQFMLDTQTGRLWQVVCAEKDPEDKKTCISSALQPFVYLSAKGEFSGSLPPTVPAAKP